MYDGRDLFRGNVLDLLQIKKMKKKTLEITLLSGCTQYRNSGNFLSQR